MAAPFLLMSAACAPVPAERVADARMEGGAAIHSVAAPRGNSVVLVLSPTDCVSCDVDLAQWFAPGRDTATKVAIVLTRAPSADEQRNLTLLRLPITGQVAKRALGRPIATPCTLRFTDGRATSSACGAGAGSTATLTLVDSVVIIETPEAYVARPTHLAASGSHGLFITDAFARNVIHVRANGEVAGGIGRRGRGPGEFEAPSTVLVAHDSLLYVADQVRGGVIVRSLATGKERGLLRMEGNRPTMTIVGDTVYAGTVNATRGTSLARWTTSGDSVRYFGTLPESFTRSPFSRFVYNVSLAAWADTVAYVVGLSEVVYVATTDGRVRDSLVVPRSRRRGVPSEARQATLRDPSALAGASSLPWALGALSDGRLVVVFADGEMRANALGGSLFVSVVDRGGGASCPDLPLPSDGHELPRIAFDGDRMLVLEQRVVGGKALNVVRRYTFPAGCAEPAR